MNPHSHLITMKPFSILSVLFFACFGFGAGAAMNSMEALTLDQALEMAESLQPQLAKAKAMVEAAEGRARQAGTFPNPEAIVGGSRFLSAATPPTKRNTWPGLGRPFR
jgi:outer membrane protein TolC